MSEPRPAAPTLLVDAAGLYFRAFHGVPKSVRAPDGTPMNAVRGYLDMTATLLRRFQPQAYAACLDVSWRPAFRVAALPTYKAHRVARTAPTGHDDDLEDVPAELLPQVPILLAVLRAIGLATVGAPGFEADDVAATLARRESADGRDVLVATGDRDLLALVRPGEPPRLGGVAVVWVGKGVAKAEVLDEAAVRAKYGIPSAAAYLDMAILRGDPSDGLPGVSGVGERTASALVSRHGTVTEILAAAEAGAEGFSPGARAAVIAAADYLRAAARVVAPVADVPLPDSGPPVLPSRPRDSAMLDELSARWGLAASVTRVLEAVEACNAE